MPTPKELHEEAVCRRFLDAYNQANGTAYTLRGLQQPPAPDCLCSGGLNLEIVTAYYDEGAAKDLWDLARGKAQAPLESGPQAAGPASFGGFQVHPGQNGIPLP